MIWVVGIVCTLVGASLGAFAVALAIAASRTAAQRD